ncbi:MAG: GGDEF domain-containing protein [Anaerolineaceae bacterium]|nr:GGDEF domain-containing protein [Anaerolineaceae bacterium]
MRRTLIALLVSELKFVISREQTISRTDFLTGLNNRREFNRIAELEILRANRHKHHFAVAYIDLDLFKDVNDKLGHAAGDELLRSIAQIMRHTLRKTDVIARMGGDEFAILLSEVDGKGAKRAIEKVQERMLDKMKQDNTGVTFSIGLVYYTRPPKSAEELLRGADNLMFRAKMHGKNKIVFEQVE